MRVGDDASPVYDKSRACGVLLLQPLPRHRPTRKVVRAIDLRDTRRREMHPHGPIWELNVGLRRAQ